MLCACHPPPLFFFYYFFFFLVVPVNASRTILCNEKQSGISLRVYHSVSKVFEILSRTPRHIFCRCLLSVHTRTTCLASSLGHTFQVNRNAHRNLDSLLEVIRELVSGGCRGSLRVGHGIWRLVVSVSRTLPFQSTIALCNTHENLLGVGNPPSQSSNVSIRWNDRRCKLDAKHVADRIDHALSIL